MERLTTFTRKAHVFQNLNYFFSIRSIRLSTVSELIGDLCIIQFVCMNKSPIIMSSTLLMTIESTFAFFYCSNDHFTQLLCCYGTRQLLTHISNPDLSIKIFHNAHNVHIHSNMSAIIDEYCPLNFSNKNISFKENHWVIFVRTLSTLPMPQGHSLGTWTASSVGNPRHTD